MAKNPVFTEGEDYAGRTLCRQCWDGFHYYTIEAAREIGKEGKTVKIMSNNPKGSFSNCMVGACQCKCRELATEKIKRVTPTERKKFVADHQETLFPENVSEKA